MSDRYWITGVQLGRLLGNIKEEAYISAVNLVDDIIEEQFIRPTEQSTSKFEIAPEDTNPTEEEVIENEDKLFEELSNEEQIKSELYKGVNPQDGGKE